MMPFNFDFNAQTLVFCMVMLLPGFISMRVYSLIRPGNQPTLKDTIFEAFAYSAINLGLMSWAIYWFFATESVLVRIGLTAVTIVIAPVIWPFLLDKALVLFAKRGWIAVRSKTAWDDFFSRRQPCWIIVHLHDGSKIGGIFGNQSYATLYPTPGHLFIEELWSIDQETGAFEDGGPVSKGIILKPEDYRFVEIKDYIETSEAGDQKTRSEENAV